MKKPTENTAPIRQNARRLQRLFSELAASKAFRENAGIGFNKLPNPDKLLRSKSLRSKAWNDLLTDTHLAGAIDARKAAVLGMQFKINVDQSDDKFSADLIAECFNNVNVYGLIGDILDCLLYGFQPIEIVWDTVLREEKTWVIPKTFNAIPSHYFAFSREGELLLNRDEISSGTVDIDGDFKYKIVVATNEKKQANPYGTSLLTRCYWAVNWKRAVRKFWSDYLERFGFPQVHVAYKPNRTEGEVENVVKSISEALQDSVFAIPVDYAVSMVNGANSGTSEIFKEFLQSCDDEISKAILGHTGAMRSEAGKLGNENVAVDSKLDKKFADKKLVEEVVNQIITFIYELNFPHVKERAWFSLYDEKTAAKERAELDLLLYQMGVRFDPTYFASVYEVDEAQFWTLDKRPTFTESAAPASELKGTVGGITVIASLVAQVDAGTVNRESAVAIARLGFGFTEGEANEIFPSKAPQLPAAAFSAQALPTTPIDDETFTPSDSDLQKLGDGLLAQIMAEVGKATSLEDALARIAAMYPQLDVEPLIESIEQVYFAGLVVGQLIEEGQ